MGRWRDGRKDGGILKRTYLGILYGPREANFKLGSSHTPHWQLLTLFTVLPLKTHNSYKSLSRNKGLGPRLGGCLRSWSPCCHHSRQPSSLPRLTVACSVSSGCFFQLLCLKRSSFLHPKTFCSFQ